jgi:pimeloyl-ACP methyl ester carboxylesterase
MEKILLLHGAIGSKAQLQPMEDFLSRNFETFSINFSGHGGREIPDHFDMELFSHDILSFLEQQKIESINIFGYSMGGYAALYFAKRYPERVKKIMTLATKFDWQPETAGKESAMLNPEKILEKVPAFANALKERHAPQDWKLVLKKTAEMMLRLGEAPQLKEHDFASIPHKVLVTVGDSDNMVSIEETEKVSKLLTNANLLVFPGMHHPIEKMNIGLVGETAVEFFIKN